VRFDGNYSLLVQSGARLIAEGDQANQITFTTTTGTLSNKYKYVQLQGGDNSIKWCIFEYGTYPLYLYYCTSGEGAVNVIENCTFRNNSSYGLRIYQSVAKIKSCNIHDNGSNGIYCNPNCDVDFIATHIHHNSQDGIYAISGNFLEFYGSVIEANGVYGIYAANVNHIHIGEPYNPNFYGYNTIRDNGNHEVYASSGNPHFEIAYSSIHDDTGLEAYNTAGNEQIYTQSCFWDVDGCQYSGAVYLQYPNNSLPDWDGDTISEGSPLGKVLARRDDGLLVDPYLSDEEKIKAYKEIIANDPKSEEAREALTWLYSIIRANHVKNKLNEKDQFFDYLQDLQKQYADTEIGRLALRYRILWKTLENDNATAIRISKEALALLTGEDRKWVLVDLAFTYTHSGQLEEAKNTLWELEEKYGDDKELIALIRDDIADVEGQIANGQWKLNDRATPLESEALAPNTAGLSQNYPNPFNPETMIKYQIPQPVHVTVNICNLIGQHVRTLVDRVQEAGTYEIEWDGKDGRGRAVPSGVYLCRIQAGEYSQVRKMALLR
jgi:hypothetical protein